MKDYYAVLGIKHNASIADIKKSYRALARKYHPDKNPDDKSVDELFKNIGEAYNTLSDSESRKLYDAKLGFTFQYNRFSQAFGKASTAEKFSEASIMVEKQIGTDINSVVTISFQQGVFGCKVDVNVKRLDRCATCDGTGSSKTIRCVFCAGIGKSNDLPCPICKGSGVITSKRCVSCKGKARKRHDSDINLDFPPGTINGETIVFKGMGNSGVGGGPNGNLKVKVTVLEDPENKFYRYGNDIQTVVKMHVAKLVLGCTIEVQTLESSHEMKIPAGTLPGTRFRMKGKGVVGGDFYVRVDPYIPSNPTDRQIQLWKELLHLSGESLES